MPESNDRIIKEKKEKIKSLLRNPYTLIFIGILLLALGIRLYYFTLTLHQPLWWDEAEYALRAKAFAFGTPLTGWAPEREIVIPFFWGILDRISSSEFLPRFFQIIASLLIVLFTYHLGKEMYNRKIGLIAAFIISVNGVMLFFTSRLLTYLWAPLFFLLTFYLFWKGYVKKENKLYVYLTPIAAALGISIYSSVAFAVFAIFIFMIITEQHRFLKRKEPYIMFVIGFLAMLPYFIYSKIVYGSFLARLTALSTGSQKTYFYNLLLGYFKLFPHLFGYVFTIFIALGAIYILIMIFLSLDLVAKNKSTNLNSGLLIMLWALVVLGFYTFVAIHYGGVIYDAFAMSAFPALAIIGAVGFSLIYSSKLKKGMLTLLIIGLLLIGGYLQLTYADQMIKAKVDSYAPVQEGGLWIKQESNPSDKIFSTSIPQMTYYSERETYGPQSFASEKELKDKILEVNATYFVDSIFEARKDYIGSFVQHEQTALVPVQAYFINQNTPVLIIYKINLLNLTG